MTAKEYLSQGYRLEQRIKALKMEIEYWQDLMVNVSSPGFEERYNLNRSSEAPYVKTIFKVMDFQDKLNEKLQLYIRLKKEMAEAIEAMDSQDEKLVLYYRYVRNYTWPRIADTIGADESTVRRWHNKALSHFELPKDAIIL